MERRHRSAPRAERWWTRVVLSWALGAGGIELRASPDIEPCDWSPSRSPVLILDVALGARTSRAGYCWPRNSKYVRATSAITDNLCVAADLASAPCNSACARFDAAADTTKQIQLPGTAEPGVIVRSHVSRERESPLWTFGITSAFRVATLGRGDRRREVIDRRVPCGSRFG